MPSDVTAVQLAWPAGESELEALEESKCDKTARPRGKPSDNGPLQRLGCRE